LERFYCDNNLFGPHNPHQNQTVSLLELVSNYVAQNNLVSEIQIPELKERVAGECQSCKGCGKKAMLHKVVVQSEKWRVPIEMSREVLVVLQWTPGVTSFYRCVGCEGLKMIFQTTFVWNQTMQELILSYKNLPENERKELQNNR